MEERPLGDKTHIQWTATHNPDGTITPGSTWNCIVGCSHVSDGCKNCYAEALALRYGWSKKPWGAQYAAENVILKPERLDQPFHWKKPRKIFVNSMSDLFHEQVPDWFIFAVWRVMALTPQHTYQILTKRPERMREWFRKLDDRGPVGVGHIGYRIVDGKPRHFGETEEQAMAVVNSGRGRMFHDWVKSLGEPPPGAAQPTYDWMEGPRWWPTVLRNVWLGVSVEQPRWKNRIDILREVPAAVRFLSLEPLLEDLGELDLTGISWVITGGESGPYFRSLDLDWVRKIRDQCVAAGVAYFHKQRDGRYPGMNRELDGRLWEQFPDGHGGIIEESERKGSPSTV